MAKPEEGEFSACRSDRLRGYGRTVRTGRWVSCDAVQEYGGAPLLEVDAGGREILVPLARSICREIDVARKIIRADLPEGLTEL